MAGSRAGRLRRAQVTWTTGQQTTADWVVRSRLGEVLIHHVDLNTGFGPGSWPAVLFVTEVLDIVVDVFDGHPLAPLAVRLAASDTGRVLRTGPAATVPVTVRGTEADLVAWLLGRSDSAGLAHDGAAPLPRFPSIYAA